MIYVRRIAATKARYKFRGGKNECGKPAIPSDTYVGT